MPLPFDPSDLSVANATARLGGLDAEELDALRDAELEGKNRITLITAIDEAASDLADADAEDQEVAAESSTPEAPSTSSSVPPVAQNTWGS